MNQLPFCRRDCQLRERESKIRAHDHDGQLAIPCMYAFPSKELRARTLNVHHGNVGEEECLGGNNNVQDVMKTGGNIVVECESVWGIRQNL